MLNIFSIPISGWQITVLGGALLLLATLYVLKKTFETNRILKDTRLSRLVAIMVLSWLIGLYSLGAIAVVYTIDNPQKAITLVGPVFVVVIVTLLIMLWGGFRWGKELEEIKRLDENLKETLVRLEEDQRIILEEKARADTIIAYIDDGIVVVDGEGKVSFMNPSAERMTGWKLREVRGKTLISVVPYVDSEGKAISFEKRPMTKGLMSEIKAEAPATNFYVRKDGTKFPVSITVTPIRVKGKIVGAIEHFRDESVERDIDRAKSEFVSLASHQLRTPLSTVKWYTEMLMTLDVGPLKKEQKKYLEQIDAANQQMIELVNSLLNVSRLELATIPVEPVQASLAQIAEQSLKRFEIYLKAKKIKLTTNFAPNLPKIKIDPKLMGIVIDNLISNAITYTPTGGTIDMEVYEIVRRSKSDQVFKISDSGYGIPLASKSKIFTKLYRADNVRDKDTTGTGLGLYIAKSIMNYSGGKIWFDSEENKGTTFYVLLPWNGMKPQKGIRKVSR